MIINIIIKNKEKNKKKKTPAWFNGRNHVPGLPPRWEGEGGGGVGAEGKGGTCIRVSCRQGRVDVAGKNAGDWHSNSSPIQNVTFCWAGNLWHKPALRSQKHPSGLCAVSIDRWRPCDAVIRPVSCSRPTSPRTHPFRVACRPTDLHSQSKPLPWCQHQSRPSAGNRNCSAQIMSLCLWYWFIHLLLESSIWYSKMLLIRLMLLWCWGCCCVEVVVVLRLLLCWGCCAEVAVLRFLC